MSKSTYSNAQTLLEDWWNADPEMRYAEVMCGENLRVRVSLFQISIDGGEEPSRVGFGESGSLEEAIAAAIAGVP